MKNIVALAVIILIAYGFNRILIALGFKPDSNAYFGDDEEDDYEEW